MSILPELVATAVREKRINRFNTYFSAWKPALMREKARLKKSVLPSLTPVCFQYPAIIQRLPAALRRGDRTPSPELHAIRPLEKQIPPKVLGKTLLITTMGKLSVGTSTQVNKITYFYTATVGPLWKQA